MARTDEKLTKPPRLSKLNQRSSLNRRQGIVNAILLALSTLQLIAPLLLSPFVGWPVFER